MMDLAGLEWPSDHVIGRTDKHIVALPVTTEGMIGVEPFEETSRFV